MVYMIITGNVQSILRYLMSNYLYLLNTFTSKKEINIKIKEKIISKSIKKIKIKIKIFRFSIEKRNYLPFILKKMPNPTALKKLTS